ncbi:MAG: diphosphomevalonate decarboxylase [Patescibacteria group bacterium]
MKKVTYKASADIALVKYWGKKDEILRLPENGSISLILDGLDTITTIEFQEDLKKDDITIEGKSGNKETVRVAKHLNRIRKLAGKNIFAKVVSKNTFPKATGLSSSGSGFSALTFAATKALNLNLTEKELSILSRQGSGTACRCSCSGIVEWKDADSSEESYSETVFAADYWDIRDIVAVVDEGKKKISSTQGHTTAQSSKFFQLRQDGIKEKILKAKKYIKTKDFTKLGKLVESECLEFHSILITSNPALVLWYPGTMQVINEVENMRAEGIEAYYTINTGFNLHVLTLPEFEDEVEKRISSLSLVKKTINTKIGKGPEELVDHLF